TRPSRDWCSDVCSSDLTRIHNFPEILAFRDRTAEALGGPVAEGQDLGEVVAGVDVEEAEGDLRRPERLRGQVEHGHGVLAAGEQIGRASRRERGRTQRT